MDNTIITNPGEIILIKIGKEKQLGFYAKVIDVIADKFKRNFWVVKFYPFVPTPDFKLVVMSWLLDDDQIRGQEFTMDGIPHQLFKVKFPEGEVIEPEKLFEKTSQEDKTEKVEVVNHIDNNAEHPNELSNLELVDADAPVPLPTFGPIKVKPKTQNPDLYLAIDNPNPTLDPTKTYEKPNLTLVK